MSDDEFLRQFENQTIPQEEWNHRAHLKIAYLMLTRVPFAEALRRVRDGVRALNAAHGLVETPTRGYHETVTHAWLQLVAAMLRQFGPADSADTFLDAQSQLGSNRALLFFYSRDRIMSPEARAEFLTPDLAPLPPA